jgi:hypothetical protein
MAKHKTAKMDVPRPPARREPLGRATLPDDVIDRVIVMLVTLRSRAEVLRACVEHKQLLLAPEAAAAAVDEALRRIALVAACDYDYELGASKTRLAELYQKATKVQDFKTALAILKERNELLALYPQKKSADDEDPARPDDSAALEQLAAARAHLAQLVEAGDDEPLDEIARRVVGLFTSAAPKRRSFRAK